MSINEKLRVGGYPTLQLFGPDGREKDRREATNLVVNTGMELIADKLINSANIDVPNYMAIGEGTTTPAVTDTALEAELSPRRGFFDSFVETSPDPISAVYVSIFGDGEATGAITEAGIFVSQAGGVMTNRVTFPVINKLADDNLQITWRLTFSAV